MPPVAAEPADYPRRILLAVVGLTPQVVTEALYALSIQRSPPFIPTEIHVATTTEGRDRILLTLLEPPTAAISAFAADYPDVKVGTIDNIHVIGGDDGAELADITSADENTIAADFISNLIKDFTGDDSAALHVSIAGGRKTMGFLAGYALSLFGREQDRLSHVLVSEAFESHPQFFYPPPKARVLLSRDKRPIRTDTARISLAEIPFVHLRHGLPERLLAGRSTYGETVREARQRFGPPLLVINALRRNASFGEIKLELLPLLFAWLVWLATRCHALGAESAAMHWSEADAAEFLSVCEQTLGFDHRHLGRARDALSGGITKEYFEEKKSRYNKLVKAALGVNADPYLIAPFGSRPKTRFGLALPRSAIRFVGADADEINTPPEY